jgi:immunity protein, SdpI family
MKNPVHPTLKTELFPILLIILSIGISSYFYSKFPEQVPTHWNFKGNIDGYSSKEFAAFFFPALNLGIYLLFLALPYIDPKKARYTEFKHVYHLFKNLIIGFLTIIYMLIGLIGIGYPLPVEIFMPILVGLLFIIMGNFMGKIKSNWMMGLRTPWTLSSEEVWNKSHRFGGKAFMASGSLIIISALVPGPIQFALFIISIAIAVILPILYSYILYTKEPKEK